MPTRSERSIDVVVRLLAAALRADHSDHCPAGVTTVRDTTTYSVPPATMRTV